MPKIKWGTTLFSVYFLYFIVLLFKCFEGGLTFLLSSRPHPGPLPSPGRGNLVKIFSVKTKLVNFAKTSSVKSLDF